MAAITCNTSSECALRWRSTHVRSGKGKFWLGFLLEKWRFNPQVTVLGASSAEFVILCSVSSICIQIRYSKYLPYSENAGQLFSSQQQSETELGQSSSNFLYPLWDTCESCITAQTMAPVATHINVINWHIFRLLAFFELAIIQSKYLHRISQNGAEQWALVLFIDAIQATGWNPIQWGTCNF